MNPHATRRHFLDRTGATLNCRAGVWQCTMPARDLSERASTAHRAVDALRRSTLSPLVRVPIRVSRWLVPV